MKNKKLIIFCIIYFILIIFLLLFYAIDTIITPAIIFLYPKFNNLFLPILVFIVYVMLVTIFMLLLFKYYNNKIIKCISYIFLTLILISTIFSSIIIGYFPSVHSFTTDFNNYIVVDNDIIDFVDDNSSKKISLDDFFPSKNVIKDYKKLYYYDYYANSSELPSIFICTIVCYEDEYLYEKQELLNKYSTIEIKNENNITMLSFIDCVHYIIECDDDEKTITYKLYFESYYDIEKYERDFETYLKENNF